MELDDAIVKAITEISSQKGLNVYDCKSLQFCIQWKSEIGDLGKITFKIPTKEFDKSLEHGLHCVSVLVAFADLIRQPENKRMIDNIKEALSRGTRDLYTYMGGNKVLMSIPGPFKYRTTKIPITFKEENGNYSWSVPEDSELYQNIDCDLCDRSVELFPKMSEYIGIERETSSGIPVLETTMSAREYSCNTVIYEHGLSGQYPNECNRNLSTDYILEDIDG